ncbi:MAG: PEP-CTERM sorting domain-containing protein [Pirellulales bacterium]
MARGLVLAASLLAATTRCDFVAAREGFWQGDVSTDWNTAGNWFVVGAPGDGSFVPRSNGGYNVRAIIGTDSTNGALNTTAGNSPLISATLPVNNQTIGGLYLGLRQLDYTFNPPQLVNPAPAAGALVGKLTISAGTLNNVSTSESTVGADGRIVVGADGRGFLTMTGGTLTGQQLVVGGENFTGDALGTSLVDLSGTAALTINNGVPASGTAALDRRLKITGPNARLTTNGTITFGSTSSFSAVITSAANAAGAAMIQSGAAVKLSGALNVEFSGAGATGHVIGNKWNLITATTGVANNFTNLGIGNEITPTGLAAAPPVGSAYYLRTVNGGSGKLVQVSYEGVLVLNVNRDTGELKITNPLGGNIAIDSYQVTSARGSMLSGYQGLGAATPGAGVWTKGLNSATGLFEVKAPDTTPPIDNNDAYDLTAVPSVSLGTGFSRTGVAANISNFGNDGEDLVFSYSGPDNQIIRGQIVYQGTKFENDLVLRVNPNTGQAFIKNDSLQTLNLDGFTILSSTGALNGAGFTGLGGTWQTSSPTTANSLTQTNLLGSTTLAPGAQLAIGDISSTNFTTQAAKDGLSLQFLLADSFTPSAAPGDYNSDGTVNAADYVMWRDHLGQTFQLANEGAGVTAGMVTAEDYNVWRANFGSTGAATPETTYRIGSVVFDSTAGSASGALAGGAVPEPGAMLLMSMGLIGLGISRRKNRNREVRNHTELSGGSTMSRRIQQALIAAACLVVWFVSQPALAVTQGISLTNGDFELPGPVGTKTIAFDSTGAPLNNIPGWTFPGPGVEDFGHTNHAGGDALGDSGTEGGGNPGNEMLLSTFDGVSYQTSTFNVVSIPATQKYLLTFDAHNIYTPLNDGAPTFSLPQTQLTARLYYLAANGTTRTTIGSPLVIDNVDAFANHSIEFVGGSAALTPALGRPIGVEFDVTSNLYNPTWVQHSWIGVDNVLLQIAGVTAGDLDGDGDVDLTDYASVRDHQQQSQVYKAQGELTGDRFVNLNDFRAFKTFYDAQHGAGSFVAALGSSQVPEPSSVALVLLLGAGAACFNRRRPSNSRLRLAVLSVISLFVAASSASAELLFYDPFLIGSNPALGQYSPDVPLGGQNPLAPFGTQRDLLTGAWVVEGTATHGQSKSTGLNYIGAPAQGGSIGTVLDTVNNVLDTRVGRRFKSGSEWTDSTVGTFYISWLQNFGTITNVTDDMGFRSMEFWRTASPISDTNLLGDFGYNAYYHPNNQAQRQAATAHMEFQFQIVDGSPVFFEDGATHLIVMKFVLSDQANSDTISFYLDPTSVTEPDLPNLAITATNVQLGALGIGQFGGFGPNLNTVDELRIANTFVDALPQLPLPGDTDGDRDVDLVDYNNIITHLGQQVGTALDGDVAKADGTQGSDGRVTIADYRIWKDHYPTLPTGSGALASDFVPEPASGVLLWMAAVLAVGAHRRRTRRVDAKA